MKINKILIFNMILLVVFLTGISSSARASELPIKQPCEQHQYVVKEYVDIGENHEVHYHCKLCDDTDFPVDIEPHDYNENDICVCGKHYVGRSIIKSGKAKFAITWPRHGKFGQEVYVIFPGAGEMRWALEIFRYNTSEDSIIIVTQSDNNGWDATVNGLIPILLELSPYYNINIIGFSAGGQPAIETALHLSSCDVSSRNNTLHIVDGSYWNRGSDTFLELAEKAWNVTLYGGSNGSTKTGRDFIDKNNKIGQMFIEKGLNNKNYLIGVLDYKSYNIKHGKLDDVVFEEIMGVPIPKNE